LLIDDSERTESNTVLAHRSNDQALRPGIG
jgi:hypothetical protein